MMREHSRTSTSITAGVLALAIAAPSSLQGLPQAGAPRCRPGGPVARVAELPEASGIAASRRYPGSFWAHNDSGEPFLVLLDDRGNVSRRVRLAGASIEDWEAVAIGPCGNESCIYIGDIGDNGAERDAIAVYRVSEPDPRAESVEVRDVFRATYPDGAHDAETLLVTPGGEMLVVTKGEMGPVSVYRFPPGARPGTQAQLERVGERLAPKAARDDRITDGAVSADGDRVVLRTLRTLCIYAAPEFLRGTWREAGCVSLDALDERQGEGVAFGDGAAVYLVGEGGGRAQPGTFGRLDCTF